MTESEMSRAIRYGIIIRRDIQKGKSVRRSQGASGRVLQDGMGPLVFAVAKR